MGCGASKKPPVAADSAEPADTTKQPSAAAPFEAADTSKQQPALDKPTIAQPAADVSAVQGSAEPAEPPTNVEPGAEPKVSTMQGSAEPVESVTAATDAKSADTAPKRKSQSKSSTSQPPVIPRSARPELGMAPTKAWEEVEVLPLKNTWETTVAVKGSLLASDLCEDVKQTAAELKVGTAVSLKGLEGFPEPSGATLVRLSQDGPPKVWWVQPEAAQSKEIEVSEEQMAVLPPLPKLGVSLACLRAWRSKYSEMFETGGDDGEGCTTADLCFKCVKPMTEGARCSLTLCLLYIKSVDEDGLPWVGDATVFVSHAWSYRAKDAFAAMESYAMRQPEDAPPTYFWFDIFTNDQHDTLSLPQLWWRDAFMEGVRGIGHTLLILSPWDNPRPLRRAWCLWEILSTSRTNSELSIEMAPSQIVLFRQALKNDFNRVLAAVSNINMRLSQAYLKTDEDMIKAAVEATVGFTDLNSMIAGRMRDWLADQGEAALEALTEEERGTSPLAMNMVRLLQDQGKLEEAEEAGRLACASIIGQYGEDSGEAFYAMNGLGRVLKDRGQYGEAEALFRKAVEGYKRTEGADSKDALTAQNNLAELLAHTGRPDEAEPLFLDVLDKCKNKLGEEDTLSELYLFTANNLAGIYMARKAYDQAEPHVKFTYETRLRVNGPRHPWTLNALNSLASAYKGLGKLEEAEEAYQKVVEARRETLGDLHMSTLTSINNLAVMLCESQKFEKAVPMLEQAYLGHKEVLGPAHDRTVSICLNYSRLLYNTDGPEKAIATGRAALNDILTAPPPEDAGNAAPAVPASRRFSMAPSLRMNEKSNELSSDQISGARKMATLLAELLTHNGQPEEAEALLAKHAPK